MVISKKALMAYTTYSKWEKEGIRRVYLNSPLLRWYKVTIYFDCGQGGYVAIHQSGKLDNELRGIVNRRFSEYLVQKGIVDIPDLNCDDWHLHFEKFDDFWNAL